MATTWVSNGADVGGAGGYVAGTQSVQYIHDTFASTGDTIVLPGTTASPGHYTWNTGVALTKAVTVSSQNTFTAGGLTYGCAYVTNNAQVSGGITNAPCISAQCGSSGNLYIKTINFYVPTPGFSGKRTIEAGRVWATTNPYSVVIQNCHFNGAQAYTWLVNLGTNGIIVSKCSFIGSGGSLGLGGVCSFCYAYGYNTAWNYGSTTGTLDANFTGTGIAVPAGLNNSYIEDCVFYDATTSCTDFEENSRVVFRHNRMYNTEPGCHGQETSIYGVRQWEIYNNNFYANSHGWTVSANFTQPAVGSSVTVTVSNSAGIDPSNGQLVCIGTNNIYQAAIIDSTHLALTNLGWPLAASPGATITAGALGGPGGGGTTYPVNWGSGLFDARGGGGCVIYSNQTYYDGATTSQALKDIGGLTSSADWAMTVFSINRGFNDGVGGTAWAKTAASGGYPASRQSGWGWSSGSSSTWGAIYDKDASVLSNGSAGGTVVGSDSATYFIGGYFTPDGTTGAVLDPIYAWSNSSQGSANFWSLNAYPNNNPIVNPSLSDFFQSGRELILGSAKPGWTPYTYPHPLAGSPVSTPGTGVTAAADTALTNTLLGITSGAYSLPANNYWACYNSWFTAQAKAGATEWSSASDTAYVRVALGAGGSGWTVAAYSNGIGTIWSNANIVTQPAVAGANQTLMAIGFCDALSSGNVTCFVDIQTSPPITVLIGIAILLPIGGAAFTTY